MPPKVFDQRDNPGRAHLFKNLNTPIDVVRELKDSPDYTTVVFRFLSRTIACIGLLSLLLVFSAPAAQRATVLWVCGTHTIHRCGAAIRARS